MRRDTVRPVDGIITGWWGWRSLVRPESTLWIWWRLAPPAPPRSPTLLPTSNWTGSKFTASPRRAARRVLIANNLFDKLDSTVWGGDGRIFQELEGAQDIAINHNTCIQQNAKHVIAFGGARRLRTPPTQRRLSR
jgi:hypothetical protein